MKKETGKCARLIATVAKSMANKAGGAASGWLTYQPKEPQKKQK